MITISLLKCKDFNLVGWNEVHIGIIRDSMQIWLIYVIRIWTMFEPK